VLQKVWVPLGIVDHLVLNEYIYQIFFERDEDYEYVLGDILKELVSKEGQNIKL
jgi:hypothetical protein